jgi:hypothetical protein
MCAPVIRMARRMVRRNWRTIKKVAAALVERGELTGDEIDRLIGRASKVGGITKPKMLPLRRNRITTPTMQKLRPRYDLLQFGSQC